MATKKRITVADVAHMSVPERIQLAWDIWDSIPAAAPGLQLTDEEKSILDRRLRDMKKNPGARVTWKAAKARTLGKRRRST